MTKRIELTRQELYDAVWLKPASTLAAEYGISDVAIAKACKRHDIPKPPVGYWQRKANGHSVSQTPLPKTKADDFGGIQFFPRAQKATCEEQIFQLAVPEGLRNPHPLIVSTNDQLRRTEWESHGRPTGERNTCVGINVSRQQLKRTLRLMNALIKEWERRQGTVEAAHFHAREGTKFIREGITVHVRVIERRQSNGVRDELGRRIMKLTGNLTVKVGYDRCWNDRAKVAVEDIAGEIYLAIEDEHSRRIAFAKEAEERRQSRLEIKEQEERLTLAKRATLDVRNEIDANAERWEKAEKLRRFSESVKSGSAEQFELGALTIDRDRFVQLVIDEANRIDPTASNSP